MKLLFSILKSLFSVRLAAILLLSFASMMFATASNAQVARPRFDTTVKKGEHSARVLTYNYVTLNDFAGADSASISTQFYETTYKINLLDSFTLKQPNISGAYDGDIIRLYVSAASGTPFLKFYGTYWLTQGTATLTTNKVAMINFRFDGNRNKWVEVGRLIY